MLKTAFAHSLLAALVLSSSFAQAAESKSYNVKVEGLHCAPCVQAVKEALGKVDGIDAQSVQVSLKKKEATFTTKTEDKAMNAKIQQAIEDAGYTVSSINGQKVVHAN